jgi:hypothetical protein
MATKKTRDGKNVTVHTVYKTQDGKRVPGVTTILGVLNKPALMHWAWKLGTQGIDYRAFRDDKADIGTLAHAMILDHNRGRQTDTSGFTPAQVDMAENSFLKYLDWEKAFTVDPVLVEEPLVSEEFRFGGTMDNYCMLNGEPTLVDYKTGKGIYTEYFYQVAAYKQILLEHGYPVTKIMILRIGRDEMEGFEVREIINTVPYFEVFRLCRQLYDAQKLCG